MRISATHGTCPWGNWWFEARLWTWLFRSPSARTSWPDCGGFSDTFSRIWHWRADWSFQNRNWHRCCRRFPTCKTSNIYGLIRISGGCSWYWPFVAVFRSGFCLVFPLRRCSSGSKGWFSIFSKLAVWCCASSLSTRSAPPSGSFSGRSAWSSGCSAASLCFGSPCDFEFKMINYYSYRLMNH